MIHAGTAKCEITTPDPNVKVRDPLYARVLVLDNGAKRLVMISMDCISIGDIGEVKDSFLPRLRGDLESGLGIDKTQTLVSATHTHVPGKMICDEDTLVKRIYGAVSDALTGMIPVRIGVGYGHDDSFAVNRTLKLKDGSAWSIRQAHPLPKDEYVGSLDYCDHSVPVIRLDREDGSLFAVVCSFGCHPLVGFADNAVSAQYPGIAVSLVEELTGCDMAMFMSGCSGDVTEVTYKNYNAPKDCTPFGQSLGLSVVRALNDIKTDAGTDFDFVFRPITLPRRFDYETDMKRLLEQQERLLDTLANNPLDFKSFLPLYLKYELGGDYPLDRAHAYLHEEATGRHDLRDQDTINRKNIDKYLACIEAMEKLSFIRANLGTLRWHKKHNEDSGKPTAAADMVALRIGRNDAFVSAPFEALSIIGRNVAESSPFENTHIFAYANGYMHYGAPADMYESGGYETIECMLDKSWQTIYETAASEMLCELYDK